VAGDLRSGIACLLDDMGASVESSHQRFVHFMRGLGQHVQHRAAEQDLHTTVITWMNVDIWSTMRAV